MSFLNVYDGKVEDSFYSRLKSGNTPVTDVKLYKDSEIKALKQHFFDLKSCEINTIGSVYFHKSAIFPRKKFGEIYQNDITRKIDRAEYVVINKDVLANSLGYVYGVRDWWQQGSSWLNHSDSGKLTTRERFIQTVDWITEKSDLAALLQKKKVILDTEITKLIPRNSTISGDLYSTLGKLLGSTEKLDVKIGVQMMVDLNYNDHKAEIALLLNQNLGNINSHSAGAVVMFRSLLGLVDKDFPKWRSSHNIQFMLAIAAQANCSEVVMGYVGEYFNNRYPMPGKKYKLIVE